MEYMEVALRPSAPGPLASVHVPAPTIEDVRKVAVRLSVFSPATRQRAFDALPKVMKAGEYWSCGATYKRRVAPFDGNVHPYRYCQEIERTAPVDDEDVLQRVRHAAYLILVWYVDTIADGEAHRAQLLRQFFIMTHKASTTRKRADRIDRPTLEQQRARTCFCSEELVAYVRTMHSSRRGNEFDRIRRFLTTTLEGRQILDAAGVDDAFQLDHYVPECMGGPSVIENAHIMPNNGANQHFRDSWNKRKREYCGEAQHEAIRRIMPGLVDDVSRRA